MNPVVPKRGVPLFYVLPLAHLCACLTISVAKLDGWVYMFVVNFPVSTLLAMLAWRVDQPLLVFGVLGTLWWYLLGYNARFFFERLMAKIQGGR
jgi:hypothetical protein